MNRIVILIFLALINIGARIWASNQTVPNNDPSDPDWQNLAYIEEGTVWEIEVQYNHPNSEPFNVKQWLDGTEDINGRTYLKYWSQVEGEDAQLILYVRLVRGKNQAFCMAPDDPDHNEYLLYQFNYQQEPAEIASVGWDGTISDKKLKFSADSGSDLEYSELKYYGWDVSLYDTSNNDCLDSVEWLLGMGTTHGFLNQCYSLETEYTTTLKRLLHCGNEVIYDNTTANIDNIQIDNTGSNIKYRADGTLFREGDKGLYIMNGKKYIAR